MNAGWDAEVGKRGGGDVGMRGRGGRRSSWIGRVVGQYRVCGSSKVLHFLSFFLWLREALHGVIGALAALS